MCGIIAYIGNSKDNTNNNVHHNSYSVCLCGLKQLQNRGYDSAGICSIIDNKFVNNKFASSEEESALSKLEQLQECHGQSTVSIGHTRWATHGAKTDTNSHPHISSDGLFSLVHNGIIENYAELKEMLIQKGYTFSSQTDTEVVVNLLAYHYSAEKDVPLAIEKTIDLLEGTWGLPSFVG